MRLIDAVSLLERVPNVVSNYRRIEPDWNARKSARYQEYDPCDGQEEDDDLEDDLAW